MLKRSKRQPTPAKNVPSSVPKKKRKLKFKFTRPLKILVGILIVGFISVGITLAWVLKDLPSPTTLDSSENFPVSTQIFDRNQNLLYEIYADENRTPIKLSDLPPHVYQA